jgi:hypothetical protein
MSRITNGYTGRFRFHLTCDHGDISIDISAEEAEQLAIDAVMFFKQFRSAAFLHSLAESQIREYRVAMATSTSSSQSGVDVNRFLGYGIVVVCVAVVVSQADGLNTVFGFLGEGEGNLSLDFRNGAVHASYRSAAGRTPSYQRSLTEPNDRLTHH